MGITSGQRSDRGEEKVVLGCYTPNNILLPSQTLYAHYLVQVGVEDYLLGYTLDGVRPAVFTIDLATLVPGGGVWTPGSCDGDFTDVQCLEYIVPARVYGYVTGETLRDSSGNVFFTAGVLPTLDSALNSAVQDYDTGLVYFLETVPQSQATVVDPSVPAVVSVLPLSGGLPFPTFWRASAFNPVTGEIWAFGSLGPGFTIEAYTLNTTTGFLTLRWVSSFNMNLGGGGAAFNSQGRLYMRDEVTSNTIVECDPNSGNVLDTITLPANFWNNRAGMSFDENDVLHIANYGTNTIETYVINPGLPQTITPVGTYGGFVGQNNFELLRSVFQGPTKFRRYFHKDFNSDFVTIQDHDYVTGDVITLPEDSEVGPCDSFVNPTQNRTPAFRTEVIDLLGPGPAQINISSTPGLVSWTVRNRDPNNGSAALTVNGVNFLMDGNETMSSGGVNEEKAVLNDSLQVVVIGPSVGVRITLLRRV
jgi:hypothetical protein